MSVAANRISDSEKPAKGGALLDVRDLCVSFRDDAGWVQMLNNVAFTVKRGETLGIVGESGCGKSLTALSVMALLPKRGCRRTGNIFFDGNDIAAISEAGMRKVRGRQIGMVFQEPMSALDPVFTVGDQIAETVRTHFPVSQREAKERAIEALDSVRIAGPANCATQYPMSLSGGMRQRVMIAMALVCEPKLLIADEPTTALDVTIQAQIMESAAGAGPAHGHRDPVHHPQSRPHRRELRAHDHDVCRRSGRGRRGRGGAATAAASLYRRACSNPCPEGARRNRACRRSPAACRRRAKCPTGCRFAARCTYVTAPCAATQHLRAAGDRHVRCVRADGLALAGSGT